MENPFLTDRAEELISELLPRVRTALRGKEITISRDEAESFELFLDQIATDASPRLKRAIRKANNFFRKEKTSKQLGPVLIE